MTTEEKDAEARGRDDLHRLVVGAISVGAKTLNWDKVRRIADGADPPAAPEPSPEQEYWATVRNIAEEAEETWCAATRDGDDPDDAVSTFTHESLDSNYWVIYYHATRLVLRFTNNDDAAFDQFGDDALLGKNNTNDVFQLLAFCAMEADVQEAYNEPDEADPRIYADVVVPDGTPQPEAYAKARFIFDRAEAVCGLNWEVSRDAEEGVVLMDLTEDGGEVPVDSFDIAWAMVDELDSDIQLVDIE